MTDSSARRPDGTAGRVIGSQALKELRSYTSQLRELGHAAATPPRTPPHTQVHVGPACRLYGVKVSTRSTHGVEHC